MDQTTLLELLDSFHRARVLVLGDVMLDRFVYGTAQRISPEAPIPVLTVERTADMPGGAANVARNAASMGAQVTLIGVVGDDGPADSLREQLATVPSIDIRLTTDRSRPTTVKTRHVADRQQMLRVDVESRDALAPAIEAAVLSDVRAALDRTDLVVLSDYAKGTLSEAVAQAAIEAARERGKIVLVDPKSRSFSKYRGATVITPNRAELQLAAGRDCAGDEQIVAAAMPILEEGTCAILAVTRGKDGISVVTRDAPPLHLRALAREVYDVSGAGDTVVATLAIGLAIGADISAVSQLANVAAGIVVGKTGTATVTSGELVANLAQTAMALGSNKLFSIEAVPQVMARWRERGLRIAFTNGCFDLLHPGHVSLFTQARQSADRLIVGLNSDLSVRRLKGAGRPVQSEVARATVLASLACVDAVVIFSEDTPLRLIEILQPDVLVKGADYTIDKVVGADVVMARGGKVLLVDLVADQSTTNSLRRMAATQQP